MNVTFVKRGTVINISRPKRFAEKVGLLEIRVIFLLGGRAPIGWC